ncbi:MAG TPA: hypothetical protein VD736_09830 [Nitrososphaera sp.]|nr:hypothetical protein [Nitrososphaera sp.]
MTLFPEDDILTREIESWRGFADSLRAEDRELFKKMLNDCYRYGRAVNAKGEPFPAESLLMALIFSQHKMIGWLISRLEGGKR